VPAAVRPLIDTMGVRHIVTPPGGAVSGGGMTLAYDGPDGRVFVNEQARPRFTFVDRAVWVRPGEDALERLVTPGPEMEGGPAVILEAGDGIEPQTAAADGGPADGASAPGGARVVLDRGTSESLTISVSGHGRAGWLVIADAWDPGWQALVNDRPGPVLRADYVFRAVAVPAADSIVTLTYRPVSFRAGIWVSALSLLVTLAVGIAGWGRSEGGPGSITAPGRDNFPVP